MKFRHLLSILLISSLRTAASFADRGDEILPLVQSENLKAHIIALQENGQQTQTTASENVPPSDASGNIPVAYRTRSSYHRGAADNAARYIVNQFQRSPKLEVELEEFSGLKNVVARLPAQKRFNKRSNLRSLRSLRQHRRSRLRGLESADFGSTRCKR